MITKWNCIQLIIKKSTLLTVVSFPARMTPRITQTIHVVAAFTRCWTHQRTICSKKTRRAILKKQMLNKSKNLSSNTFLTTGMFICFLFCSMFGCLHFHKHINYVTLVGSIIQGQHDFVTSPAFYKDSGLFG